jgi:hypothetical protein
MSLVPEISWPQRNTRALTVMFNDVCFYFSYSTLVGIYDRGKTLCLRNSWGLTKGRHIKGFDIHKAEVVTQEELARYATEAMVAALIEQSVRTLRNEN